MCSCWMDKDRKCLSCSRRTESYVPLSLEDQIENMELILKGLKQKAAVRSNNERIRDKALAKLTREEKEVLGLI